VTVSVENVWNFRIEKLTESAYFDNLCPLHRAITAYGTYFQLLARKYLKAVQI